MRPTERDRTRCVTGFTLVELIVSIALISLLSMAAIPLLKLPLEGWMDATRRANLSSELDIVHAKLRDDLALALPGSLSVRRQVVGGRVLLEYLEVRASGRYRTISAAALCPSACNTPGDNDTFEVLTCPETCFANLSPWDTAPPTLGANDWVVVGPTLGNAYALNGIRSRALAAQANGRVDVAAHVFPVTPANERFYIISGPVTYECNPLTRQLTRYSNYPISALQPSTFVGASRAILSSRVQVCALNFAVASAPTATDQRGIVSVNLRLGTALGEPASSEVADLQASFAIGEN